MVELGGKTRCRSGSARSCIRWLGAQGYQGAAVVVSEQAALSCISSLGDLEFLETVNFTKGIFAKNLSPDALELSRRRLVTPTLFFAATTNPDSNTGYLFGYAIDATPFSTTDCKPDAIHTTSRCKLTENILQSVCTHDAIIGLQIANLMMSANPLQSR